MTTPLTADSQKLLQTIFGTSWLDAWVCWKSNMYGKMVRNLTKGNLPADEDCYFSIALLAGDQRMVENAVSVHAVVIDDVGTKIDRQGFDMLAPAPTWWVESSPGNFQMGYVPNEPLAVEEYRALRGLMSTHAVWGKSDAAMDPVHLYRLPQGTNTKNGHKVHGRVTGGLASEEVLRGLYGPTAPAASNGAGKVFDWTLSLGALQALVDLIPNPDDTPRDTWIAVLHGVAGAGGDYEIWDSWSSRWVSYDQADTTRAWDTLDQASVKSGGGVLRAMAEAADPAGFEDWRRKWEAREVFDDDPEPWTPEPEVEPPEPDVVLTPEGLSDTRRLPRRPWLYGRRLLRGYLSSTVAAGGTGKSSLAIVEAMAMVTGKDLLGVGTDHMPRAPLRVLIWNGEDPKHELSLRLHATAKHYGVVEADFADRLFMLSGRDRPIRIGGASSKADVAWLRGAVRGNKIDVVVIDPFVSSHGVSENDNMEIDKVAKTWAKIAEELGCAVELVHHIRKPSNGGAVDLSVDDARGASALVNASRNARVLSPMPDKVAKELGIANRRAYFAIQHDATKANMSPSAAGASWFKFVSVDLDNGDVFAVPPIDGDSVGVVEAWVPTLTGANDPLIINKALDAVASQDWKYHPSANDWVGRGIAGALGLDPKGDRKTLEGIIEKWRIEGWLKIVNKQDKHREMKDFIEVGNRPVSVFDDAAVPPEE